MPQCSDVVSMLHHRAICWWVTAPYAPNVKMPLDFNIAMGIDFLR